MSTGVRTYLVIWAVLMLGAALELIFVPRVIGSTRAWGMAPGWQREIGFWNVGMLLMIRMVLRQMDRNAARRAALVLCILSILFGTNHLAAFM